MHANSPQTVPAERRTSRTAPPMARRVRTRGYAQRRRAVAAPLQTASWLQQFWDEHAVKTGMLMFYAWFTVANWSKLTALAG